MRFSALSSPKQRASLFRSITLDPYKTTQTRRAIVPRNLSRKGEEMRRREFLVAGATATLLTSTSIASTTSASVFVHANDSDANKLTPPAEGTIPVAFAISRGA